MLAFARGMLPVPTLACFAPRASSVSVKSFRVSSFVMSITDPISSVVAKPSKFPFLSCPAAALAPSIVIRRRRTCTRSGSRTSPAFARRRHSYSASLGFSGGCPCLVRRHAAEAGGKGVRWRAARGAAVAAAGRKRGRSGPRVPPVGGVAARPVLRCLMSKGRGGPVARGNPRVQR